jgi:uncharacterized protein (TIGR02145 family)
MKVNVFLPIFAFGLVLSSLSQKPSIELSFTAVNNEEYVTLDSILIKNVTKGCDTTLYSQDTVLVLDYLTNIHSEKSINSNTFSLSQNYPNPFNDKTEINLFLQEKEFIKITVQDIMGRELAHFKKILNPGKHSFMFIPGNDKYYLLTVFGEQKSETIKMLNSGRSVSHNLNCRLVYNKFEDNLPGFKSQIAINAFTFDLGDEMRYTGYANTPDGIFGSAVIDDIPLENMNYQFSILKGLRCPDASFVTDIDGNQYNTVQIGSQCWMNENLKTTTYKNGSQIPNVSDSISWIGLTTGAYIWYNNAIAWKNLYGALYNWAAIDDSNGLCPTGWHTPADDELTMLTDFIGGTAEPNGNKLKSCRQVNSPWEGECSTSEHPRWNESTENGSDDYGFSGLPGGYRNSDGAFLSIGIGFNIWSSTEIDPENAWSRNLNYLYGYVGVYQGCNKQYGLSVRCIKD